MYNIKPIIFYRLYLIIIFHHFSRLTTTPFLITLLFLLVQRYQSHLVSARKNEASLPMLFYCSGRQCIVCHYSFIVSIEQRNAGYFFSDIAMGICFSCYPILILPADSDDFLVFHSSFLCKTSDNLL